MSPIRESSNSPDSYVNGDNEEAIEVPFVDETEEWRELEDIEELEEEEFGEDLEDTIITDYRPDPNLDRYEADAVDDGEFSELDMGERRALEEQMRRRDRRLGRIPRALDDSEESDDAIGGLRRRRDRPFAEDRPQIIYEEREANINLSDTRDLPVREFLALDNVRREIGAQFTLFLTSFVDESGVSVYGDAIMNLCSNNESSLRVDYQHLCHFEGCGILAMYLVDAPIEMFRILDEATTQVILRDFEKYHEIHEDIHVRIYNLPLEDKLRDLREAHLNTLVKVTGVVTRRTSVLPQLQYVQYDCGTCGHVLGPFMFESSDKDMKIGTCPNCQARGSFSINTRHTVYKNYQQIWLQECPGSVSPGRLPVQKKVILLQDLVDSCKPGDEVEVIAVYRNNFDIALNKQQGFPVFTTILEANNVQRVDSSPSLLTSRDKQLILEMGEDPRIGEKIIRSIAPSIHGHENIKMALALALFGGEAKYGDSNKHRVRGDINVLICGDPGTGKSQFLKYVEQTAPRCMYTTGQGASAVGLTASVHKDPVTREWMLEGGALVLADRGICLIDEFDKMSDQIMGFCKFATFL
jgi:DNA replication licensing factor MCM2